MNLTDAADWEAIGARLALGANTDRDWPLSNKEQLRRDAAVAALAAGKVPSLAKKHADELVDLFYPEKDGD